MNRIGTPAKRAVAAGLAVLAIDVGGCSTLSNPFVDELSHSPAVSTPSADTARAAQGAASDYHRDYEPMTVSVQAGGVTHAPVYYWDPRVPGQDVPGRGQDDSFALTHRDYFYGMVYGPAAFLVQTATLPLRMIPLPPWTAMVSEGAGTRRAARAKVVSGCPRSAESQGSS